MKERSVGLILIVSWHANELVENAWSLTLGLARRNLDRSSIPIGQLVFKNLSIVQDT